MSLEISAIASKGIILSRQRTAKALNRLCGCAGWSAPLLFAYVINRFSHDETQFMNWISRCVQGWIFTATEWWMDKPINGWKVGLLYHSRCNKNHELFEPRHEKNLFLPHANNKGTDQHAHPHSLISAFVISCLDSIIPILAVAELSRL